MKIMAVNAGSSSLKFQLLEMPAETVVTSGVVERIGLPNAVFSIKVNGDKISETLDIQDHTVAVKMLLKKLVSLNIVESYEDILGVGHRVVHGGEKFSDSVLISDEVLDAIDEVSDLAPLHNPANLTGIIAFKKALPNAPQVAVFDTAFHQTMQEDAYMYSTPYEWYEKYRVRKYGFHGTSHKYVSQRVAAMLNKDVKELKTIVLHIGNGASLCAVDGGISVDTSMGFTPLAGISMGTRSGDIDPAIIEFITTKENKTVQQVMNDLNKASGYLGISRVSSDSRDLWDAAYKGDEKSLLAIRKQAKQIADYIGSYFISMGGVDAIAFTAGVGENAPNTREMIVERISTALGAELDLKANEARGVETIISSKNSKVHLLLVPTNEEVMIARDTVRLMK
ncbi:MAG: acetate kinase [Candidatus Izemoplasmataceae bacterium]|uniref:acetate kinase n=1 Tax=Liberiplasma polymorphum TaxID=3374570 RepID=UPI0037763F6C